MRSALATLISIPAFALAQQKPVVLPDSLPPARYLPAVSPEEQLKTIQLPDGYRLELVLSEPEIKEPMAMAFDGNGRIYVVEMRTYMQDIDATNELTPKSRVSRHESTKRDGRYDKHTVFADGLIIPRMVQPLQSEVLIGETNTNDIQAWSDKDGDGVAESKSLFYEGGPRGGNMEHQPSGLLWAMDNWLYTTYNAYRLRWSPDGKTRKEPTAPNGGQWGLTQDDWGKPWFSNAGGEKGVWNFQMHVAYGAINVPEQWAPEWMTVWPSIGLGDVQGGPRRYRPTDFTLNHFTGSCGQEVFRGDRLPEEVRGNVFLPEPVGRLIRRGVVEVKDGITTLRNPHGEGEFIRSSDANFRPVDMKTGPDGCLYIVDAYRGIIQEGNWTRPGSFLRPMIERYGLEKNIGRGRIWRLVHKDFKPGPQPRMLDESSAELTHHLAHPNGWWRDTAQKLLVVRQDKSVVPALTKMTREHTSPLARAHAMWTLEGLGALDAATARGALKDSSPRVRENALRAAETLVKAGDTSLSGDLLAMAQDSDPNVVLQAIGTAKALNLPAWQKLADTVLATTKSAGVKAIGNQMIKVEKPQLDGFSPSEIALLKKGEGIYKELCFACHGFDGKGTPMQGLPAGVVMAPPLSGSKTVTGHPDGGPLVLLHGLAGPVNGKTYEAQMASMGTNDDAWIAAISSYIRVSFGNRGSLVTAPQIAALREAHKGRTQPWTEKELRNTLPVPLKNAKMWKLTASNKGDGCSAVVDGKADTRWDTGASQTPGQWFQIELPDITKVAGMRLDCAKSGNDYPRGFKVEVSTDGADWKMVGDGKGSAPITEPVWPATPAKFIKITQTGSVNGKFWSIHELSVLAGK
jgi:glucose/arabinose dehydrogenase/mono/diheme cytochrome c family protein